jgi:hypothetical protein
MLGFFLNLFKLLRAIWHGIKFDKHVDAVAFRVELVTDENGKESIRWTGLEDGKKIVFYSEPYAGFWKKLAVTLLRVLPVDAML